jgi:hypothetical protein
MVHFIFGNSYGDRRSARHVVEQDLFPSQNSRYHSQFHAIDRESTLPNGLLNSVSSTMRLHSFGTDIYSLNAHSPKYTSKCVIHIQEI